MSRHCCYDVTTLQFASLLLKPCSDVATLLFSILLTSAYVATLKTRCHNIEIMSGHSPHDVAASSNSYANLFPSVGTKVVKHYTTVVIHRSSPQGVVF